MHEYLQNSKVWPLKGTLNERIKLDTEKLSGYIKRIYEEKTRYLEIKGVARSICARNPRDGKSRIMEVVQERVL